MCIVRIFAPWYRSDNVLKRQEIARRIKSQKALKKAALLSPDHDVRSIAAARITDEEFLFTLIHQEKDWYVQTEAVGALKRRDLLAAIAYDQQLEVEPRAHAARKIGDTELANELEERCNLNKALNGFWEYIDKLKSAESLAICVRQCSDPFRKELAVRRIHDNGVLEELIRFIGEKDWVTCETKYRGVLESAVEQIQSEQSLERLAQSKNEDVRRRVLSRITDSALLLQIARQDDNVNIRYSAARRLPEEMFAAICAEVPEIGERFRRESEHSERSAMSRGAFTDDSSDWVNSITGRD